ncbi:MAG: SDR family NAD(P)-dependent oxidoreductase [Acetobacteraceae bacterium]|nr:SDR family NAD(P)-dependent oxidoreductase [Acetobacteraceae bacterium]MBV8522483.1 SDR family NAD(P)-dependent oxidoreductase [Acetobacteraceae bacterium]MBV8591883.1 SDR family NAD(P)-dependent oxidoreductase [Acetobacteraceae bacterium]
MERLKGKVAVITGGCSGIGRAAVERFVEEGACVVLADIQEAAGEEVARAHPGEVRFQRCDVTRGVRHCRHHAGRAGCVGRARCCFQQCRRRRRAHAH